VESSGRAGGGQGHRGWVLERGWLLERCSKWQFSGSLADKFHRSHNYTLIHAHERTVNPELLDYSYINPVFHISGEADNSRGRGGWNNGVRHSNDVLQARANVKNNKYKDYYGIVHKAFTPAIVGMSGQIHADFLRLLWVLGCATRLGCAT